MGQVSLKYESFFWKFEISISSGGQEPKMTLPIYLISHSFYSIIQLFLRNYLLFYTYRNIHLKLVDSLKIQSYLDEKKKRSSFYDFFKTLNACCSPNIW